MIKTLCFFKSNIICQKWSKSPTPIIITMTHEGSFLKAAWKQYRGYAEGAKNVQKIDPIM
jgi:hypothetical protein